MGALQKQGMSMRFRTFILGVALAALACAGSRAPDYDFRSALSVSSRHSNTVIGRRYEREVLIYAYQDQALPKLKECQTSLPNPNLSGFSAVFVIDKTGKVSKVYLDRRHNLSLCFRRELLAVVFPEPPFDGFHKQITIGSVDTDAS